MSAAARLLLAAVALAVGACDVEFRDCSDPNVVCDNDRRNRFGGSAYRDPYRGAPRSGSLSCAAAEIYCDSDRELACVAPGLCARYCYALDSRGVVVDEYERLDACEGC